MANSALHPKSATRASTVHVASQFVLRPPREEPGPSPPPSPSFVTCPSYSSPFGLVPKTKPFWWSR